MPTREDEWLWGWDPTPGIVSIWAERDGRAFVWRRLSPDGSPNREIDSFRPWLLLDSLDDLLHLGNLLSPEQDIETNWQSFTYRELEGPGHLRYLVSAPDGRALEAAVLTGASSRMTTPPTHINDLGDNCLCLPPEEQYLVATGRTYFRDLAFDDLHRLQFDLETTGLDATTDHVFLVAIRTNRNFTCVLDVGENGLRGAAAEADLIQRLARLIRDLDPDVIENHNLLGFDLPFLAQRAQALGIPLILGRTGAPGLRQRAASRGYGQWRGENGEANPADRDDSPRALRYTIPGRECIDTLDAVRRYDFAARDLPGHGLKAVARHFGIAPADRTYLEGSQVFATWQRDPETVRRYALNDVEEAGELARLLGGAAFALAQMAPRRYERLADAGPATGIIDPLIARAYLRSGQALPAYSTPDGTHHTGAALYLFASGIAQRIVKADVASLYPSLMRQYHISPRRDHLGVLLALVDRLVEHRLAAKARAKAASPVSSERFLNEAISAAMKILVNSAYGYMGATGLTRLADVTAANEVTRRGRETLDLICQALAERGATLLEADTDGVYFAAPADCDEQAERQIVAEVAAMLPPLIHLEFEGRFAAMLSHEPKNYALLTYSDRVLLHGVAFRSSRFEPFGEQFLRQAIGCLLRFDIAGIRDAYLATYDAILRGDFTPEQMSVRLRLTKTKAQYLATRSQRREAPYEAMLVSGRQAWARGESMSFYRGKGGAYVVLQAEAGNQDYDASYYLRQLRTTYAERLARAFTPDDFATLFADPTQPTLFTLSLADIQPILTILPLHASNEAYSNGSKNGIDH
jgi:DNA polymerase, archaea type